MTSRIFSDNIYNASENFKKCYAKGLVSLKCNRSKLSEVAEVIPYSEGCIGDIYICFIECKELSFVAKVPYITKKLDDERVAKNHIKYVIRLNDRGINWKKFVFEYLMMTSYEFSSAEELVNNSNIPTDDPYLQMHVSYANEAHNNLIEQARLCRIIIQELEL